MKMKRKIICLTLTMLIIMALFCSCSSTSNSNVVKATLPKYGSTYTADDIKTFIYNSVSNDDVDGSVVIFEYGEYATDDDDYYIFKREKVNVDGDNEPIDFIFVTKDASKAYFGDYNEQSQQAVFKKETKITVF